MIQIYEGVYQNSQYRENINLSVHQYLLMCEKPALVHTGGADAAAEMIPSVEEILGEKELGCIFVSHIGADECGGLQMIADRWPDAEIICSEQSARELPGFGMKGNFRAVKPGEHITGEDYDFQIIDYPSEAHLRSGILVYEAVRGVFFSSDLMLRAGFGEGKIVASTWDDEIRATGLRQVPNRALLRTLRRDLSMISPKFIAVGHGFCMRLRQDG